MKALEIQEVAPRRPIPTNLVGFGIDSPKVGQLKPISVLEISGWVIAREKAVKEIEIVSGNRVIGQIPVDLNRAGISKRFTDVDHSQPSGFIGLINLIGLPQIFELRVRAVLGDGVKPVFAIIQGERPKLSPIHESHLQPLLLTSRGRSGSTWVMRLLAEHPSIIAHRVYPYETRIASYWMHAGKVLTSPGNHTQSANPDNFWGDINWLGTNPYYTNRMSRQISVEELFSINSTEKILTFCKENIDDFYNKLLHKQAEPKAHYFVEKYSHAATHIQWMMWELYPRTREIILIRDFRDMICSILAFNSKRGNIRFGRELVGSDEEYINRVRGELVAFRDTWKSREERVELIRYEDLIQNPNQTLFHLLNYLRLDSTEQIIQEMLKRASQDTEELNKHKTTASAQQSIGRWKRDMTPEIQKISERVLTPLLKEFGYSTE